MDAADDAIFGTNIVECHSGHTYATRPTAVVWQDQKLVIETILAEWQSPEGKQFRVQTKNGLFLELFYDPAGDNWQINEV